MRCWRANGPGREEVQNGKRCNFRVWHRGRRRGRGAGQERRHIERKVDNPVEVKYILDVRDFPDGPFADKIVHDFSIIEQDPEVSGWWWRPSAAPRWPGLHPSGPERRQAVWSPPTRSWWPSTATSCSSWPRRRAVSYLFEASVGGGIPILRPLSSAWLPTSSHEIVGILNGTTNYILTRMIRGGPVL